MKAAILYGPKDIRLKNIKIPSVSNGEILVKIKVALTCGTDAKVYQRGRHSKMIDVPSVFGHEWAGVIEKTGKDVRGFQKGDRVVAANSVPCFKCYYCKLKKFSLCDSLTFLNGAYAQYIKIPEPIVRTNLFKIPKNITFEEAAFLEPLSCVIHGIEEVGIKKKENVVINGAGPIGLIFLLVLKNMGSKVAVVEKNKDRLKIAMKLGCDKAILAKKEDDSIANIKKIFGRGADVAIEATGISEAWENSIEMVRKGGKVLFFGGCRQGEKVLLDTELVHYNEIVMRGVFHHTPIHVKKAYDLIIKRKLNLSRLITGKLPLNKISRALDKIIQGKDLKIVIVP